MKPPFFPNYTNLDRPKHKSLLAWRLLAYPLVSQHCKIITPIYQEDRSPTFIVLHLSIEPIQVQQLLQQHNITTYFPFRLMTYKINTHNSEEYIRANSYINQEYIRTSKYNTIVHKHVASNGTMNKNLQMKNFTSWIIPIVNTKQKLSSKGMWLLSKIAKSRTFDIPSPHFRLRINDFTISRAGSWY